MDDASTTPAARPAGGFRIWHLSILVLFVAVAIVNIQDQRIRDRRLIALASAGFLLYGLVAWYGWRFAGRYRAKLGATGLLVLYLMALGAFFMVATVVYVVIEYYVLTAKR
jgi:hypothetical protein